MSTMSMSTTSMSTMSSHHHHLSITISLSPSLPNHHVITISLSQSHYQPKVENTKTQSKVGTRWVRQTLFAIILSSLNVILLFVNPIFRLNLFGILRFYSFSVNQSSGRLTNLYKARNQQSFLRIISLARCQGALTQNTNLSIIS